MYLEYLRGQNIEATVDSDGDVAFQYELPDYGPMLFYIIVYEDDPQLFHILIVGLLEFENTRERDQAYIATVYATRAADTVKMYVNESGTNVWASGEVFLESPGDFRFVFPKMMSGFEMAFDTFVSRMR
jgi:hypothetical protein